MNPKRNPESDMYIENLARVEITADQFVVRFAKCQWNFAEPDKQGWQVLEDGYISCAANKLILDFQNVEYPSSAFLGKLVMFVRKVQADGREVVLGNISESVHQVLRVTGLDRILSIERSSETLAV